MQHYRTEVIIPADRSLCLQLPDSFPAGRATVTVLVQEPDSELLSPDSDLDDDRLDIEWWEEFEEGREHIRQRST